MSFRTGPQAPLGNGSTLSLLGFHEDEELRKAEDVERAYRVFYLANVICDQAPPTGTKDDIVQMHAKALLRAVAPFKHMTDGSAVISSTPTGRDEMRVIFRNSEIKEIRNPNARLRSLARGLAQCWDAVRFAEYGEANGNNTLTFQSGRKCPIQPYQVNLHKSRPIERTAWGQPANDIPLGFESEPAEKVAGSMIQICRARGEWGTFHNYGLLPGQTLVELLREKWEMTREEYDAGLRYLVENEYLAEGTGAHTHFLREKFVVLCWRKGLEAPIPTLG